MMNIYLLMMMMMSYTLPMTRWELIKTLRSVAEILFSDGNLDDKEKIAQIKKIVLDAILEKEENDIPTFRGGNTL